VQAWDLSLEACFEALDELSAEVPEPTLQTQRAGRKVQSSPSRWTRVPVPRRIVSQSPVRVGIAVESPWTGATGAGTALA